MTYTCTRTLVPHPAVHGFGWGRILRLVIGGILTLLWAGWLQLRPAAPNPETTLAWGRQPALAYLVLTPSLAETLRYQQVLSPAELALVQQAAYREQQSLLRLERLTLPIVGDPGLTLAQKRLWIARLGYNQAVSAIIDRSRLEVQAALPPLSYLRFISWLERTWAAERIRHSQPLLAANPRTFRVYATRYDSKGAYTVALPDKCVKFANGGSHICDADGYTPGQGYSVYLTYQKSAGVTVGESGPWNVDDNYWARRNDPQPRRMFADLGLGIPEAQAAYFNGYNGGQDQFGRKVTGPYGIDLARQVSIDIGLEPGVNDWVTVSFMWTAGWDGGAAPPSGGTPGVAAPTLDIIQPVEVATPQADGSVVHVVQPGQALWSIAIAYQTTIQDIRTLNDLTEQTVIIPGQELLIFPAGSQPAQPSTATLTPSPVPTESQQAPGTASWTVPASLTPVTAQPTGSEPARLPATESLQVGTSAGNRALDPIALLILALVLLGLGLLGLGKWLERGG